MKQNVYFGTNFIAILPQVIQQLGKNRILLITGTVSFHALGGNNFFSALLRHNSIEHFWVDGPYPHITEVEKGLQCLSIYQPELIIAIGGGKVLDTAKLIRIIAAQEYSGNIESIIVGKVPIQHRGIPLVAIPTTAGSGSETTHFAAIYINKAKFSLAHPFIIPNVAIVDPSLTYTLSSKRTAVSGLDALSQAIESFWSTRSTSTSRCLALQAMRLCLGHLEKCVSEQNLNSRYALSYAAHLAGKAINITKTTAPHAMSYILTSHFQIPHGHAVALTLGATLEYNAHFSSGDMTDQRGVRYLAAMFQKLVKTLGTNTSNEARRTLEMLLSSLELEIRLSALGITSDDIEFIAESIDSDRAANNPRRFNSESAKYILNQIF